MEYQEEEDLSDHLKHFFTCRPTWKHVDHVINTRQFIIKVMPINFTNNNN